MAFRILHWLCRCLIAAVFVYSGYLKLRSELQFAAAIAGYQLVPAALILPLAEYLPWLEISLGILLLTGWKIRYVSLAAAALLLLFTTVLTITYARGIEADCGCFGFGEKISPLTIARDALFLLPAVFLSVEKRISPLRRTPRT
jgi:uncharacterized membrane protein YphA (DoxX/SURF4 family)